MSLYSDFVQYFVLYVFSVLSVPFVLPVLSVFSFLSVLAVLLVLFVLSVYPVPPILFDSFFSAVLSIFSILTVFPVLLVLLSILSLLSWCLCLGSEAFLPLPSTVGHFLDSAVSVSPVWRKWQKNDFLLFCSVFVPSGSESRFEICRFCFPSFSSFAHDFLLFLFPANWHVCVGARGAEEGDGPDVSGVGQRSRGLKVRQFFWKVTECWN